MTNRSTAATTHEPVLLQEVLQGLAIAPDDVVFDGTAGGGGHAEAIALMLDERGIMIECDLDAAALARVEARLAGIRVRAKCHFAKDNFRNLAHILAHEKIPHITKVLFDLGLSSDDLEASGRGFSFRNPDEPLLMTFNDAPGKDDNTAATILNYWSEASIADILWGFGGERRSRVIARAIVESRRAHPFITVGDLLAVIESTGGRRGHDKIHPATKTFQALRVAVNDETGSLEEGIKAALVHLQHNGRIAIIAFESVTDRIVKRAFAEAAKEGKGTLITKRAVQAGEAEKARNPRARSAKLRIFQKK